MRFAIFVDGSNLFGSMAHMNLRIPDYQRFYDYVFRHSVDSWKSSMYSAPIPAIELRRVYWYSVGDIDNWNLNDAKAQSYLKDQFDANRPLKAGY